jgi:hypothetical protein
MSVLEQPMQQTKYKKLLIVSASSSLDQACALAASLGQQNVKLSARLALEPIKE